MRLRSWHQAVTCTISLILLTSCGNKATPLQNEAQQIVQEQQHIASVSTMTSLLRDQQSVEATATAVVMSGEQTVTATTAQIAVRATQGPIIAAATVAAAESVAKIQATVIVESAQREQILGGQTTATAQIQSARATADSSANQAAYLAWRERKDAAAHYVISCIVAYQIASETTSLQAAITTAQNLHHGSTVGSCPDKSE